MNENPCRAAFIIEELTDLVEEAVLTELERINERGGVLGAMETGYQRGQDPGRVDALRASQARRLAADHRRQHLPEKLELARSTEDEKQSQLKRLQEFHMRNAKESPAMLKRLQQAVIDNRNVFEVLMDAVRVCSLGQITGALFEVGGQYRRNM
jgi:methylmalonyl-CoA mutase